MHTRTLIESLLTPAFLDEAAGIRRHLHKHPELSFAEHQTSSHIRSLLDSWGIAYEYPFVKTGILVTLKGKEPGKRLALRSDMDALPITEDTGLPYQSVNPGVMHACGHDVHMASLLGAIRILNQLRDRFRGEILCVFQPGEERIPGGARLMLEEGMFEGRHPDMILAQHVLPQMEAGHVGFKAGRYMASSDEIYVTVKGKGGHGALPQDIDDPVLMAAHLLLALQHEVNRKSPPDVPTVLSFGKIDAPGAVNVIPDQVRMEGTFRTMDEAWRQRAHELISRTCLGVSRSLGGDCELEIRRGYPVLINDEDLTLRAAGIARDLLGAEKVEDMGVRMTAEDFAWFAQKIPGLMFRLGVKTPGAETTYALHTSRFQADESALWTGILMLAGLSLELLG
ncbi:MAG: M20 family metallopeptidase [Bacteroidales bacterium]